MRKDISSELYNYNKYPGPDFHLVNQLVQADRFQFELQKNVKDAFDVTVFSQRFSEVLTKFDYIVGDWSNEQLRLKGFYNNDRTVDESLKIHYLDDYLLEYCSFGCSYFVLFNPNPKRASFDEKLKPKKEYKNKNKKKAYSQERKASNNGWRKKRSRSRSDKTRETSKRHFVIRQKEEN